MTSSTDLLADPFDDAITGADANDLGKRLATDIADHLRHAIERNGSASLVVSGGSTPKPVFAHLSTEVLAWNNVSVTLADERWVPPSSEDSNERLVRNTLLINEAAGARFVPLYREASSPQAALDGVDQDIAAMTQPFTVVILGMGGDGHTASLFPDTDGLNDALDLANRATTAILRPASVPQVRISLTRQALLKAEHRILHITGNDKRAVLTETLAKAPADRLPIGWFFDQPGPAMQLYWSA